MVVNSSGRNKLLIQFTYRGQGGGGGRPKVQQQELLRRIGRISAANISPTSTYSSSSSSAGPTIHFFGNSCTAFIYVIY